MMLSTNAFALLPRTKGSLLHMSAVNMLGGGTDMIPKIGLTN